MIEIDSIIQGDSEHKLKEIDDCSVDLVVTDPPYGYSFMGKNWDKALPSINIWHECFRILKDGAFMFVMSSPRQDVLSRMIINLEDAGLIVGFTSIYWTYASGFPKASNISKMVDKKFGAEREVIGFRKKASLSVGDTNEGWARPSHKIVEEMGGLDITIPFTPEAKALDGSYGGFQPKPAVEVVLVVMKPLSEKTFVDQALKNGHGVSWLNDGRIPIANENDRIQCQQSNTGGCFTGKGNYDGHREYQTQGRFPANLLVSDDVLNDGINHSSGAMDCIAKNESGVCYGKYNPHPAKANKSEGSFSRYFSLDSWWDNRIKLLPESVQKTFPFIIVPKASKSEKNKGCEGLEDHKFADKIQYKHQKCNICGCEHLTSNGLKCGHDNYSWVEHTNLSDSANNKGGNIKNFHPTVKPLKLFSYLITLGSREGDLIVDPFVGSGTSCVSAKILNRRFIGIDNEAEYVTIANKRIEAENSQMEFSLAGG